MKLVTYPELLDDWTIREKTTSVWLHTFEWEESPNNNYSHLEINEIRHDLKKMWLSHEYIHTFIDLINKEKRQLAWEYDMTEEETVRLSEFFKEIGILYKNSRQVVGDVQTDTSYIVGEIIALKSTWNNDEYQESA